MKSGIVKVTMLTLAAIIWAATVTGCGTSKTQSNKVAGSTGLAASAPTASSPTTVASSAIVETPLIPMRQSTPNLSGKWSILAVDNGNTVNGWFFMQFVIDRSGVATCLIYTSAMDSSCDAIGALPQFSLRSDGLITTSNTSVYGVMEYDNNSAYIVIITGDGVSRTGTMTRALETFDVASMEGDWTMLVTGKDANYAWAYEKLEVNSLGESTCLSYNDASGNNGCIGINAFPTFIATPDGVITTNDNSFFGVMNYDGNTVHLATILDGDLAQIAVLTRSSANLDQTNLTGNWNVFLADNGNTGNKWSYIKMNVSPEGQATCLSFLNNTGGLTCDAAPALPVITLNADGTIRAGNSSLYGLMDFGKDTAYLVGGEADGVTMTGIMTKVQGGFAQQNLRGRWSMLALGNGNDTYGWAYLTMDIDNFGEATCLTYLDINGNNDCNNVGGLPAFSLYNDGEVISAGNIFYGAMTYDKKQAVLATITDGTYTQSAIMSKRSWNFRTANLAGKWNALLTDNGNTGAGWAYVQMTINWRGQPTCLKYLDSKGVASCAAAPALPTFSLNADGLLTSSNAHIYGVINHNATAVNLATITTEGVTQKGFMTKVSNNFGTANLAGNWVMVELDNGGTNHGWFYMSVNINDAGQPNCLAYNDGLGNTTCAAASNLPMFSVAADGTISTGTSIYGFMGYDGTTAYLVDVTGEGVTRTAVMTRR